MAWLASRRPTPYGMYLPTGEKIGPQRLQRLTARRIPLK
jgi:hypothetical protein